MEILLLEDINGIGKKNDLLVVGDGFALNFLLPQRKALVATPTVRKRYADVIRKRAEEKEGEQKLRMAAASALAGKSVTFSRKATKTSKLYAAITPEDISEALKAQHSLDIPADSIHTNDAIKALGTFQATVKVGGDSHTVGVVVTAEK